MEQFYWFFIISVILATFFMIFRRLTIKTYVLITILVVLYITVLVLSFAADLL
ncbi:hypothetical protein QRD89_01665 [Halobacillus sp. ACCC02827]|uniref:hypothetical protein n=1 Tax=unclassified Halobacillus TaxID=2636472 RepID=UPI000A6C72C5|nr:MULTISPECIES: hypothetical protein [unclassified Halobacillus]WJE16099.1 hypothetical protein QRD89_01665 [Halobacillus sp. ACCC02827]